jgi:hypothetical protein
MNCLSTLLIVTAAILPAQSSDRDRAHALFLDGTQLEIYTDSTGSTKPSTIGAIGIGPAYGNRDMVNRIVVDTGNNILFAYNIEATRGAVPNTVLIRILPLSPAVEKSTLEWQQRDSRQPKFAGEHIPTVAAVREFSAIRIGEVVTLDILLNRATGEKIYDLLRPISSGETGHLSVTSVPSRAEVSLKEIVLQVNQQKVRVPVSWLIGAALRIDIPGHGVYVVAVDQPDVPPIYSFQTVAHADGKTLRWVIDGDTLQIDSATNILTHASNGVLWVYHDPRYRSQNQPDTVRLQTADTVDWLIPRREGE